VREASRWYIEFKDHRDARHRIPAFTDKATSEELGRKLERLAEARAGHRTPPPDLLRWIEDLSPKLAARLLGLGLLDEAQLATARPLMDHVEDFNQSLLPGRNRRHVEQIIAKVKRVIAGCGFKVWQDIQADAVDRFLRELRSGKEAVGVQTSNYYLGAIRQFCRWMVAHGRVSSSPLAVLRPMNAAVDRKRIRRALTEKELKSLLRATERGPVRVGMTGKERALVYRLAVETGLRAGELRSLMKAGFDLTSSPPTVAVEAAYSKRRRRDVLPLRVDTAKALAAWLRNRKSGARAFDLPSQSAVRKAFGEDLVKAKVTDLKNRLKAVDFHSLRHTFLTNLARAGVHPKTAQALARHSTITLTLDRYTHVALGDEVRAIEALPRLSGGRPASSRLKATGTDGAMQPGCLGDLLGQTGAGARRSSPADAASRPQEAGEWYARKDSNLRLSDPKSDALSS